MNVAESKVIPMQETGIVAYNEFRSQLAELKATNAVTIFQYTDPKGNKAARSYIAKLRSTKAAVDRVRKEEKAASLEYGRKVDAEAKEIISEVEAMIHVHQTPLDEIENKEKERVAAIRSRIDRIKMYQECVGHDSKETGAALKLLRATKIDETFAEFQAEAFQEITKAIFAQESQHALALDQENSAAELESFRQAEATRLQKEREEKIASDAAENAKKLAEQAAAEQIAKANAAAKKAEEDVKHAAQTERDKIANESRLEAESAAKREADKQHRAKINNAALAVLIPLIASGQETYDEIEKLAKSVVEAIAKGEVPNVKIIY